jgi:Zn-dependent M28 family amino/carboxypeptidase
MKKSWLLLPLMAAGCATVPTPTTVAIGEPEIRATVATLASDAFEGRMAGTAGEIRTTAYLADRFRAAGLTSGARGPTPYLDPFTIKAVKHKLPPADAKMPGGQRGFMERMNAAGTFTSNNVVAVARGTKPDGKIVVVMAHWDHVGICMPEEAADRICNGAVDNASGVAALVAVAEKVAAMRLDRDVWFIVTSGEEWGLLGAKAIAEKPPFALASVVAGFNLDTIAIAPRGAPVAMVAPKGSPLEPIVKESARALGRAWDGDDEAGPFIKRQDGWAFAQYQVPFIMAGGSFSDLKLLQAFLGSHYHGPDDELTPETDLGGAVDDANLHVELIRRTATRRYTPRPLPVPTVAR